MLGAPMGLRVRDTMFEDLGTGNLDFTYCSVSKQQCDLAPSLPFSELSFICKTGSFVRREVSSSRIGVLESGIRVILENWLKTLPHFLWTQVGPGNLYLWFILF